MKNRVAWGLVVLAVLVLSSGGWLFVSYQRRLPLTRRVVFRLSPSKRGFGRVPASTPGKKEPPREFLRLGSFAVRIK
jgi:hypothetical protein